MRLCHSNASVERILKRRTLQNSINNLPISRTNSLSTNRVCNHFRTYHNDGFTRPITIDDFESSTDVDHFNQSVKHSFNLSSQEYKPRAIPPLPEITFPTNQSETIYQLASGVGNQSVGVAIIRLSGPLSKHVLSLLTRRPLHKSSEQSLTDQTKPTFQPRMATRVSIYDPLLDRLIDHPCLALLFNAPRSFTGDDVVELHCHGNPIVIASIMKAIQSINQLIKRQHEESQYTQMNQSINQSVPLLRESLPGEFTRRAFDNGKLDLTQIEALSDLLTATTEHQHSQSINQLVGELSRLYASWRTELIGCLAHIEAILDFGEDEPDVSDADILNNVIPRINRLTERLNDHMSDSNRGELIRHGLEIAIVGLVNAGKSTLINQLTRRDIAIVSEMAGTTRDSIEASINLSGYAVRLVDTAGLRQQSLSDALSQLIDPVEREGIRRARSRAEKSHIKLVMIEANQLLNGTVDQEIVSLIDQSAILVLTKCDLLTQHLIKLHTSQSAHQQLHNNSKAQNNEQSIQLDEQSINQLANQMISRLPVPPASVVPISCHSNIGINQLLATMTQQVKHVLNDQSINQSSKQNMNFPVITRARHRVHLEDCQEALERSIVQLRRDDLVLAAELLRVAVTCLGRIVGRVDVEEILDVIFADFCIGK